MVLWKKLWYYIKNFRTLINYGKNYVLSWKKLWYYSKLQLTIVSYSLLQYFCWGITASVITTRSRHKVVQGIPSVQIIINLSSCDCTQDVELAFHRLTFILNDKCVILSNRITNVNICNNLEYAYMYIPASVYLDFLIMSIVPENFVCMGKTSLCLFRFFCKK